MGTLRAPFQTECEKNQRLEIFGRKKLRLGQPPVERRQRKKRFRPVFQRRAAFGSMASADHGDYVQFSATPPVYAANTANGRLRARGKFGRSAIAPAGVTRIGSTPRTVVITRRHGRSEEKIMKKVHLVIAALLAGGFGAGGFGCPPAAAARVVSQPDPHYVVSASGRKRLVYRYRSECAPFRAEAVWGSGTPKAAPVGYRCYNNPN
jgi:hypothetical protein